MVAHGPFDWSGGNADHIRRHGVEPHEAEEAVEDPCRVRAGAYRDKGEARRGYVGATARGRLLVVVLTRRAGGVRVVTAREATKHERRRYRRRRP